MCGNDQNMWQLYKFLFKTVNLNTQRDQELLCNFPFIILLNNIQKYLSELNIISHLKRLVC